MYDTPAGTGYKMCVCGGVQCEIIMTYMHHSPITNSSSESRTIALSREDWRRAGGGFPRCVVGESVQPLLSLSASKGRVSDVLSLLVRAMSVSRANSFLCRF